MQPFTRHLLGAVALAGAGLIGLQAAPAAAQDVRWGAQIYLGDPAPRGGGYYRQVPPPPPVPVNDWGRPRVGYWTWDRGRYVWIDTGPAWVPPGHRYRPHRDRDRDYWVEGAWVQGRHGPVWVPGHWR